MGRLVINHREIRKLLRGEDSYRGVRAEVDERLKRIAASAGPGHVTDAGPARNRYRGVVITASEDARLAEARDHNLLRALDSAR